MNPYISFLKPYPFEKLATLKNGIQPMSSASHIPLSIGEPKHKTPDLIIDTLQEHINRLSSYPTTKGIPEIRISIANWLNKRFNLGTEFIDPESQVLPVNGTREALFAFAQTIIDPTVSSWIVMPNPFYQIYEGAALLAGAKPYYLNTFEFTGYLPDLYSVPKSVWNNCQLVYICSPGNPTGAVFSREQYIHLLELAEQYEFVIASDECYSEIYHDEQSPPPGLLEIAHSQGNTEFKRCVVFHSLSKRSNAPGLRSGFVAGDAEILSKFFQYRTYHGCAMSLPTQYASIAAWDDENHVIQNRKLYRDKFTQFIDILTDTTEIRMPEASFYVWLKTPISDTEFAQKLFQQQNVTVLPGSFLSRDNGGQNPGKDHVRIALVASPEECIEAALRIKNFIHSII